MKAPKIKKAAVVLVALALFAGLVWQFGPFQAIFAVANLTDPRKLATLGERGANPRLNKTVYWLKEAESRGMPAGMAISFAQWINWTTEPRASLVKESLLRNVKIADGLGLMTADNRMRLRNGRAGVITKGPYVNTPAEVDHIVPYSLAPEAGNELANLELMPQELNRRKSNRVGERQLAHAERLYRVGLLTQESLARVKAQAVEGAEGEGRTPAKDAKAR
ncbi:MAG: hypothetical protein HY735_02515 [Verrucomicrobia bacterium]|nr:hypothetical protein [Verrucomicrobiota bacterium]